MTRAGFALVLALAACGNGPPSDPCAGDGGLCDPPSATGVDVLFVIDSTSNMGHQESLIEAFAELISEVELLHGGRPDLHVGVVSQDLGAGGWPIMSCEGMGEEGQLLVGQPTCAPSDRFIRDVTDGAGGRVTNYPGTIDEAFACNALLGFTGCGFEQPLAALELALDPATVENAGFLGEGHGLVIVILMDEDDCSAADTDLYNTSEDEPLGYLTSFRCFEFGVVCDPDQPRALGDKLDCVPRTGSYLVDPLEIAAGVRDGRTPGLVAVHVIAGDLAPVAVGSSPDMPEQEVLVPSCFSARGRADPAIRLDAFARSFGPHGDFTSICAPDFVPAMRRVAAEIAAMLD